MDEVKEFLKKIKKPKVDPDREDSIESDVGDSVSEAYVEGFNDGCDVGRYKLAKKLLKMLGEK